MWYIYGDIYGDIYCVPFYIYDNIYGDTYGVPCCRLVIILYDMIVIYMVYIW